MRELSLHVLDIVQNSLSANASLVIINVLESTGANLLQIEISDNGKGLTETQLKQVLDPFFTTRTTRKVGLGLSMFQAAANRCGGDFRIESEPDKGTSVIASFKYDDIDRPPLGNMANTIISLVVCHPEADFSYRHRVNSKNMVFDTREIKKYLSVSDLTLPNVISELNNRLIGDFLDLYQSDDNNMNLN